VQEEGTGGGEDHHKPGARRWGCISWLPSGLIGGKRPEKEDVVVDEKETMSRPRRFQTAQAVRQLCRRSKRGEEGLDQKDPKSATLGTQIEGRREG